MSTEICNQLHSLRIQLVQPRLNHFPLIAGLGIVQGEDNNCNFCWHYCQDFLHGVWHFGQFRCYRTTIWNVWLRRRVRIVRTLSRTLVVELFKFCVYPTDDGFVCFKNKPLLECLQHQSVLLRWCHTRSHFRSHFSKCRSKCRIQFRKVLIRLYITKFVVSTRFNKNLFCIIMRICACALICRLSLITCN